MRIVEEVWHAGFRYPAATHDKLTSQAFAEDLWRTIEHGPSRPYVPITAGTNAIVTADERGMIACGAHSSGSTPFGTGLMVDGVTIPRPTTWYAVPAPMPPGISGAHMVLRDGKPVLATASPSVSFFPNILQNTVNVLEFGMDVGSSVRQPRFAAPHYPSTRPMVEAGFSDKVLRGLAARGMAFQRVSPYDPEAGSCHAVHVTPNGLAGAADPRRLGRAQGL